jgi:hypothetical protein
MMILSGFKIISKLKRWKNNYLYAISRFGLYFYRNILNFQMYIYEECHLFISCIVSFGVLLIGLSYLNETKT